MILTCGKYLVEVADSSPVSFYPVITTGSNGLYGHVGNGDLYDLGFTPMMLELYDLVVKIGETKIVFMSPRNRKEQLANRYASEFDISITDAFHLLDLHDWDCGKTTDYIKRSRR